MAKDVVVHIQRYDGTWDILGQTVARGIVPDDVELQVDEHGPKTASFTLRRTRGAMWPDVRKYARVLVQVAGLDVWGGRVADTPVKDDADVSMSVQCEGAQAHLDDDVYERRYVVTDLSAWQDRRSNLATTVGTGACCAAGQISNDGGLTLQLPKDYSSSANDVVGVMLDMGVGGTAAKILLDGSSSNNGTGTPELRFSVASGNLADGSDASTIYGPVQLPTLTASFSGLTGTAGGKRYVFLSLYVYTAGTLAADSWVKFSGIQVFADSAYESGGASALTLDTIAGDALDRASVLFDADRSLVEAPGDPFYLPEFSFTEPRTPRQAIEAGNAFEDMLYGVDHRWRVFLRDRPALSEAQVEIGAWSGSQAEDQGEGDEIYSRCIVKASAPDGSPIRAERTQAQQDGVLLEAVSSPAFVNPTFDTDASGVTALGGTKTRDTGTKRTGAGSLRWDETGASDTLQGGDALEFATTGTFRAGITYAAHFWIRPSATNLSRSPQALGVQFGDDSSSAYTTYGLIAGAWDECVVAWTPTADSTTTVLRLFANIGGSFYLRIDDLALYRSLPTLVDKAGFQRTKVIDASFMLTDNAAQRIADKYLAGHKTTPFKGRRTLTGSRAVRHSLTGQYEGLERLLLRYGQPLMDTSATDPDTGLPGRAGRIASVSYKSATDTAVVELDNSRARFDALLERIGLVVGQGTR